MTETGATGDTDRPPEPHTALVVEGGAMRGVFSTGVLDAFLEREFNPFDLCFGVSAGATNVAAYLAQMPERNFRVYTDYSLRPEFVSVLRFLRGGHLMDLDWLWEITIRELRLNIDTILTAESRFYMALTRVRDGRAVYARPQARNLEQMLKASSAMPVFYRGFVPIPGLETENRLESEQGVDEHAELFVDGGLADPIPAIEAHRMGARRIMVLRSRPRAYRMKPRGPNLLLRRALRSHPELLACISKRPERYNRALEFMRNPPTGCEVLEVNPPKEFESSRLTRDRAALERDYRRGLGTGAEIVRRWRGA